MEERGGWTMTGPSVSRRQRTHPSAGTHCSLAYRRRLSSVRGTDKTLHFAHCAMGLTILAPSAPWRTCIHHRYGACLHPIPLACDAGRITFAFHRHMHGTCFYRHVYTTCQLPHRARDCPRTPVFKQQQQQRGPSYPPAPPQAPQSPAHKCCGCTWTQFEFSKLFNVACE